MTPKEFTDFMVGGFKAIEIATSDFPMNWEGITSRVLLMQEASEKSVANMFDSFVARDKDMAEQWWLAYINHSLALRAHLELLPINCQQEAAHHADLVRNRFLELVRVAAGSVNENSRTN